MKILTGKKIGNKFYDTVYDYGLMRLANDLGKPDQTVRAWMSGICTPTPIVMTWLIEKFGHEFDYKDIIDCTTRFATPFKPTPTKTAKTKKSRKV